MPFFFCRADEQSRPDQPELKVWGKTWPVITSTIYSRIMLITRAGGFCSLHYHRERANRFSVESGAIYVFQHTAAQAVAKVLNPGDQLTVLPMTLHSFGVLKSGIVIEEYVPPGGLSGPPVRIDDIQRLSQGSKIEPLVTGLFCQDVINHQRTECEVAIHAFCQEHAR